MRFALCEIKQHLGRIRIRPSEPRTSVVRPVVDVHALVDQSQSSGILEESTELQMSSFESVTGAIHLPPTLTSISNLLDSPATDHVFAYGYRGAEI